MYFVNADGEYVFNPALLKDAHNWCQTMTQIAMEYNTPKVVVSNTFTQEWEMEAYYKLAEDYGYVVFSLVVENRHSGINEHGVPFDKLEQMKNRFEIKL
jgi:uncharacterized protein YfaS (alpha-2-macroglobulin family)